MVRPQSEPRAQAGAIVRALRRSRGMLLRAGVASAAINVLALTGSVYALQIYNGVLPARSAAALAVLTLVMLGLYAAERRCSTRCARASWATLPRASMPT